MLGYFLFTCPPLCDRLPWRYASADSGDNNWIESSGFQGIEVISVGFTGNSLIFNDNILMNQ